MKNIFTILLLFLAIINLSAEISVKSFRKLENDLDARVNAPIKDFSGDISAIIKVVTTQTGFTFDCGQAGIVKTVNKPSEIWVYVPYGVKRISIMHDKLGQLRDYMIPMPIEKATVYEMVLTMGKVITTVDETLQTQFVIFTSTPSGCDVFINDQHKGKTPFQNEMTEGEYTYRIDKDLYYTEAGKFIVNATDGKKTMPFSLRPNFGFVQISTKPEINANVSVDGIPQTKTSPLTSDTLRSGKHKIELSKPMYHSQTKEITIVDNQTIPLEVIMNPAFGSLTIDCKPETGATVSLNGKETGKTTPCKLDILSGEHTISLRKEWYEPVTVKVKIQDGIEIKQTVDLKATYGNVKLTADAESELYIDNQPKGKNQWEGRLIAGLHSFEARKEKHHTVVQKIEIDINETKEVKLTPQPIFGKLKVVTNAIGAVIKLNGKEYGTTPNLINDLFVGNYNLTIEKVGYGTLIKNILIAEGKTTDIKDTLSTGMQIMIQSTPTGATLYIDNEFVGKTPVTQMLSFGNHKIRLENGKKIIEEVLEIKEGGKSSFSWDVNEVVSVFFTSKMNKLFLNIDGKNVGEIPTRAMMKIGSHQLTLKNGSEKLVKEINVSSNGKNEFNFKSSDFVRDFYQKHLFSLAYSYHETTFANSTFTDRIANGNLSKEYGHALTFTTNLYPFSVNATVFSSGFKAHNLEPFNENASITHRGIEVGVNYVPINIGSHVYPYLGAGYQLAQLYSPAGSMTIEGAATTNTSLPVLKGGLQIRLGQLFIFGEYKQTISVGGSTYNSQQLNGGVGWAF